MEIQLRNSTNLSKKNKRDYTDEENEQNLLEEVLNLIETINKMRFIEKISRPIDKRLKEEQVQKFAGKMQMLHHKLSRIEKQCSQKLTSDIGNLNNIPKTKQSMQGSNTMKVTDWRKSIRTIESRYIEVHKPIKQIFYEGSFKHYKRLMILNNFTYKLDTINIHEWATNCLSLSEAESKCCCC